MLLAHYISGYWDVFICRPSSKSVSVFQCQQAHTKNSWKIELFLAIYPSCSRVRVSAPVLSTNWIDIEFGHLVDPAIVHTEPFWPIGLLNQHDGATPVTVGLIYYPHLQQWPEALPKQFSLCVLVADRVVNALSCLWMFLCNGVWGLCILAKHSCNEATSVINGDRRLLVQISHLRSQPITHLTVVARETAVTSFQALRRLRW